MISDAYISRPNLHLMLLLTITAIWAATVSSGPVQWMDNGEFQDGITSEKLIIGYIRVIDHPSPYLLNSTIHFMVGKRGLPLSNEGDLGDTSGGLNDK